MPDLTTVTAVLRQMDRVTKPTGLIMLMDLVRLRTLSLTERYVNLLGQDYVQRGLPSFFDDFRNSMYAAWTAPELRSAIPRTAHRRWFHIVPRGLPSTQFVLGLPVAQSQPYLRNGFRDGQGGIPIPPEMGAEWRILRKTLKFASRTCISD
jgi:hypothetical protein